MNSKTTTLIRYRYGRYLFLWAVFSLVTTISFGQTTIVDHNFDSSFNGWTEGGSINSMSWLNGNAILSSGNATNYLHTGPSPYPNSSGVHITSPAIDFTGFESMTLSVDVSCDTEGGFDGITMFYSIDNGTTWSQLGSATGTWFTDTGVDGPNDRYTEITTDPDGWDGLRTTWTTYSLVLASSFDGASNVLFRMYFGSDGSANDVGAAFDNFFIEGTSIGPIITATPTSISGMEYCESGGPSSIQSFDVSGSTLTDNITVTAPTNFEVSLDGVTFSSSVIVTQSGGTAGPTTVYTRLVSGLSSASYGGNATLSTTGGTDVNVILSGSVTPGLSAGVLSGPADICEGETATFTSTASGGTWSSFDTSIATVDPTTGEVTGVSIGTTNIVYTNASAGCITVTTNVTLTVTPGANAGTISGSTGVCETLTTALSTDGDAGGTWSSDNMAVATVDASGVVTGVAAGIANITYTVTATGCPDAIATFAMTVNAAPNAGTITTPTACVDNSVAFASDGDAGGTWSSDDTGIATVDATTGQVTVVADGTTTIRYTVTATGCTSSETSVSANFSSSCSNLTCPSAFEVTVDGPAVTTSPIPLNGTSTTYVGTSCDASGNEETWFSFTAPSSGFVSMDIANYTDPFDNLDWAILSGPCGTLSEVACGSGNTATPVVGEIISGLTGGQVYYIQASQDNGDGAATFDVTLTNPIPNLVTNVQGCATLGDFDGGTFDLGDSGDSYACGFGGAYGSDCCDYQVAYTYTATTTGAIKVSVTGIAIPTNSGDLVDGAAVAVFNSTDPTPASCIGGTSVSSNEDIELTGINVTAGQSYLIIVGSPRGSSDLNNVICATVSLECSTVSTTSVTDNCGAGTYSADITFSSLGIATTVDITDGTTSFTNISTATPYTFNFADLNVQTISITGYDNGGTPICDQSLTVVSGCNGSDDFSLTAPDITNACSPGDLSIATAGAAVGFTGGCHDNLGVSGSTGNNVIRDCSAANFDNNTNWVDLWYQVDLPDGTDQMTLQVTGLNAGEIVGFHLHTGDPGTDASNTQVFSATSDDCSFFDNTITSHTITGLAGASTAPIYIRILSIAFDDGAGCGSIINPTFDICTVVPQPNDVCNSAINITVNNLDNPGVASTGNLMSASDEGNSIDCSGTSITGNDLWYEVLYPDYPSVVQDFYTEVSFSGTAGDQFIMNVFDVTAACGSAGVAADMDYCEVVTLGADGTFISDWGGLVSTDNQSREVQIIGVGTTNPLTISANVVFENNNCSHFQNVLPGYDIENPQEVTFNYSTDSGSDPATVGNDLWFAFDPLSANDQFMLTYSTSADITVSGLTGDQEITILTYLGNGLSANNCNDLAGDYLSAITVTSDGTIAQGISCMSETHGPTDGGYLVRIVQTAGSTTANPTVTITPNAPGPSNNSPENICNGTGPRIGAADNTNTDAAHDWNPYWIFSGETVTSSFVGANDCSLSGVCDPLGLGGVDYEAISEINDRDLWYIFEVPDNQCGSLGLTQSTVYYSMDITYDAGNAFHDGVAFVYSACDTSEPLSCSGSLDGEGETWTVDGLEQGQFYLLRVKPWDISSTPTDWSFDISVNDGIPAPCNDKIENAEGLVVNTSCNTLPWYPSLETFSAQGARDEETFGQKDVFFKFTAPLPANGGAYTPQVSADYVGLEKSWVTVFLENVSGHIIQMELWNTQTIVATATQYATSSTAGDKIWARFGNLEPGAEYEIRLYHGETLLTDVQYKIRIEAGPSDINGVECDQGNIAGTPVLCGSCGGEDSTPYLTDPVVSSLNSTGDNNHCEVWYKIDLPVLAGGSGTYWVAEVEGYEQILDFELRQQIATEGLTHGVQEDFDHPCSSRQLSSSMGTLISSYPVTYELLNNTPTYSPIMLNGMGSALTECTVGCTAAEGISRGGGYRKVYRDILGPAAGTKNYLYLRVFMHADDPSYTACHDGGVLINPANVYFRGPYSSDPTTGDPMIIPGAPDLACPTCDITNVTVNTDAVCNGADAEFSLNFDVTDGSGIYQIVSAANYPQYNIVTNQVLGTIAGSTSTGSLTINGTILNTGVAGTIDVDVRNANDNSCIGGTPVTINIPQCVATIGDFVFSDTDGDGIYEPGDGDTGIEGVTVTLYDATTDAQLATTTTDAAGLYAFGLLGGGDYYVVFTTPSGYVASTAGSGNDQNNITGTNGAGSTSDFTLSPNTTGDNLTIDAGFAATSSIGDFVYDDINGDGIQDPGETGIEGVTVTATWYGPDGVLGGGDDVTYSTVTDANGNYDIADLPFGTYDIAVTSGAPGGPGTENAGGITGLVLTPGEDYNDADFGYAPPPAGTIGDFAFFDIDGDGIYEPLDGDQPLPGVTVALYNATDDSQVGVNTMTDATGNYSFAGIPAGDYYVVFTAPSGYTASTAGAGNNQNNITGTGGTAMNVVGSTANFTFDPSSSDLTIDAGFTGTASIGDTVYNDDGGTTGTENNSIQDGDEAGISGAVITATWYGLDGVLGGGDDVTYTATTDGSGNYDIANLPPGNYDVSVTSGTPAGSTGTQNSTGITGLNITAGLDYNDADFGYYIPSGPVGTIGDFVYFDVNNDGDYDLGTDQPLGGVTVTLYNDADNSVVATTMTLADGSYDFTGVPAGTYYVAFSTPSGYTIAATGTGNNANNITGINDNGGITGTTNDIVFDPTTDADVDEIDAGFTGTASIGDTVYEDTNGNGIQDGVEGGIAGVTVEATWYGTDGILGTADDVVYTAITDGSGLYDITNLPPGDYDISVIGGTPVGSTGTQNDGGITGQTITAGQNYDDGDFGFDTSIPNNSIFGTVFLDNYADGTEGNNNGSGGGTDEGIEGVLVELLDGSCTPGVNCRTTTTDADGNYAFVGLPNGTYNVSFGMTTTSGDRYDAFSPQDVGANDEIDSDVNSSGLTTTSIVLDGDDIVENIDAGLFDYIRITGTLYDNTDFSAGNEVANQTSVITVTYQDGSTQLIEVTTNSEGLFIISESALLMPGIITAITSDYGFVSGTDVIGAATNAPSGTTLILQDFALPVDLIYFTGVAQDEVNVLRWATASEENSAMFIVERSLDGVADFREVGRVEAAGNSAEEITYTLIDDNPTAKAYYRLRIIDLDGTFEFSDVIVIERRVQEFTISSVMPVPTKDIVNVQYETKANSEIQITLTDVTGKVLAMERVEVGKGINTYKVDLSNFADGIYFVTLSDETNRITAKLVKH